MSAVAFCRLDSQFEYNSEVIALEYSYDYENMIQGIRCDNCVRFDVVYSGHFVNHALFFQCWARERQAFCLGWSALRSL